jgi:DNA polymerase III gamma/tau subunit
LCDHFRDLLFLSVGYQGESVLSSSDMNRASQQAQALGKPRLSQVIDLLCQAEKDMKWNPEHRLVAELALFKATMDWQTAPTVVVAQPAQMARPTKPPAKNDSAPAPAVEGVSSAAEADGESETETSPPSVATNADLRDRWSDVLQRLKRKLGVSNVALLQEAEPELEEKTIILRFTKQFHYDRVRDDQRRRAVEEALSEFFGEQRTIRCEMADASERHAAITETLPPKTVEKDIVELALSLFDAEVDENGDKPKE